MGMLKLTLLSDAEGTKSVSEEMFGTNFLTRYYNADPYGNFVSAMDLVGVTNLRYPGGSMTEESFLVTDPNRTVDDFGRKLTPLDSFLDLAKSTGSEVTIVIPTRDLFGTEVDKYGNRYVDPTKVTEINDFVVKILQDLTSEHFDATEIIRAFEIGNEYWGSGQMSATEYGRVVDAVAPVIAQAIESVLGVGALGAIGILAQMGSPLGDEYSQAGLYEALSVNSDPRLLADLGLTQSDFEVDGSLKWLSKVETSNLDIIEQISNSAKNAITGLVEHFYLKSKADDLQHSSDMLRYIDKDMKHWNAAGYGDKEFFMTEWNIQADNQDQFGLKSAGALLFQFESMIRMGFSEAYTWPILSGNTTELAGDIKGEPYLTPAGAALQHMADNIAGLNLLEFQDLGPKLEISGYGQSNKVVLYIASRDISTINLDVDLSAITNGLRLTSAQSINVDRTDSDGLHKLKNGTLVATEYYAENDLTASVNNLDEEEIFQNNTLTADLGAYEVLMLIFEQKAVNSAVSYALATNELDLTLVGNLSIQGTGNEFDNVLVGNSAANRLYGNAGDDTLIGLAGADTLLGQDGNDVYIVDAFDVISEELNGGVDRVEASFSYSLQKHFENLTLSGNNAISGKGNQLDNMLVGNSAANAISGESGHDTLNGGLGIDTLAGGSGNDTYLVYDNQDIIIENKDMGTDTVISSESYRLGVNVENLTLSGSTNLNATGNLLNNALVGNSGNNVLDGVSGRDTMSGGDGNDTYFTNGLDTMSELADEGNDTVFSTVNHLLFENIENLTLTGTKNLSGIGNTSNNIITGNSGNNFLNGAAGYDTLVGGRGDDVFISDGGDTIVESFGEGVDLVMASSTFILAANIENLILTGDLNIFGIGNTLDNQITGNSGSNVLDGLSGRDTLMGGLGDDTYLVDGLDTVVELAGGGVDTVLSAISYKLGANVENLALSGSSNIHATGNALNNILIGNSGNNILNGDTGRDTLAGGVGDDVYHTNGLDVIIEGASGGIDHVFSSVGHSLFDNVENLTLVGTANLNGTGNTLDNLINGNSGMNFLVGGVGDDTLNGGLGSDTLSGGAGEDVFVFAATVGTAVFDNISDFDVTSDAMWLSRAVFSSLGLGELDRSAFASNSSGRATDASDRVIYEVDTGKLFYDADGSGVKSGVLFAQLAPELDLVAEHFFVF